MSEIQEPKLIKITLFMVFHFVGDSQGGFINWIMAFGFTFMGSLGRFREGCKFL